MFEKYIECWYEHLNGREPTKDDINDFCNQYATCYEEYMTYWELMEDMFPEAKDVKREMTVKELYEWAVRHGCEDYLVTLSDGKQWAFLKEESISANEASKMIRLTCEAI